MAYDFRAATRLGDRLLQPKRFSHDAEKRNQSQKGKTMKTKLSRRTFIASAAASILPSALGHAQPKSGGILSLFTGDPSPVSAESTAWKNAGVIDVTRSPYAKLSTVPVGAVTIQDGFWSKRRKTNLSSSIPTMHDQLLAHGRMDNFLRLTGGSAEAQKGPVYSDSDIYKWMEAVGFALQTSDQPALRETTASMIRNVVA